jgi:predicted DNA-binding ribbon-helix-helix protein
MKFLVVKHSIGISGRRTSGGLEGAFWQDLKEIAGERGVTLIRVMPKHAGRHSALKTGF